MLAQKRWPGGSVWYDARRGAGKNPSNAANPACLPADAGKWLCRASPPASVPGNPARIAEQIANARVIPAKRFVTAGGPRSRFSAP